MVEYRLRRTAVTTTGVQQRRCHTLPSRPKGRGHFSVDTCTQPATSLEEKLGHGQASRRRTMLLQAGGAAPAGHVRTCKAKHK